MNCKIGEAKSNYKPLGKYIQPVVGRNNDLGDLPLMGLSIQKKFIPSIANTIGTDMSTYRTIYKNQFAYGPVTSRNGDKITIALFNDYEKALISQAYIPFEVKDSTELDPEYLMMWFRRPEFDRYARFKSHGSAREIFDWEEMCNTLLPIPHPDKQKEIVKEYNVIQNRIALNQQLIQKLEETAQAIYKQWFVEFEFPDENGKSYKSNGGEFIFNEELQKEIPFGWKKCTLKDISNCLDYKRRPLSGEDRGDFKGTYPYYGAMGIVDYVLEYLFDGEYLLFSEDGVNVITEKGYPSVFLINEKFWVNNHAHILEGKDSHSTRLLYSMLKEVNVNDLVTGAAQPKINQENMNSIKLLKPELNVVSNFDKIINPIFDTIQLKSKENHKLIEMKDLLLSKLATIEN
jgi:type I restriction enzyme, S subunit